MIRSRSLPAGILLLISFSVSAQTVDLAFAPRIDLPFGPLGSDGAGLYSMGGGGTLNLDLWVPRGSPLLLRAQVGYDLVGIPSVATAASLHAISLGAGGGVALHPVPDLTVKLALTGGVGMFFVPELLADSDPTNNAFFYPFARADAAAGLALGPVTLSVGADYTYYVTEPSAYHGLGVSLGATFHLAGGVGRVRIKDIRLEPVFPVFHAAYDEQSMGSIIIANEEGSAIRDVRVSFFVKDYMDSPAPVAVIREMKVGEEKSLPLFAIFNDRMMMITEGTKLSAEVKVEYVFDKKGRSAQATAVLTVYDRNAITWDDDRKAAAFVTAKSPTVLSLSKSASALARGRGLKALNVNFRTGVALFEALGLYGMEYVVDPSSSYKDMAAAKKTVDYVQFPVQSLEYRSGDCDDLSVLYAALLESVAVKTAFITVPGHIYLAFSLNLKPAEAGRMFHTTHDLIVTEDDIWLPVEVTMTDRGFLAAWRRGAEEWREANSRNLAGFFEVEKAWETYSPVGIEERQDLQFPKEDDLARRYASAVQAVVQREIREPLADLEKRIAASEGDPALLNRLGVLYVRYGLAAEAELAFSSAISRGGGVAPLVNMANLSRIRGDTMRAIDYYRAALEQKPDNVSACVGLLLAASEVGQDGLVAEMHERLRELDSRTAAAYERYLTRDKETSRAAGEDMEENVIWDE
jgi:hypothetical protein